MLQGRGQAGSGSAAAAARGGAHSPAALRLSCRSELRVLPPPERAGGERLRGGGGADIAAHHGLRAMARVPHDVALVHAGLGEGGDAAGAQAVRADAGECCVPVAGFPGALFQDQADAFGGEGMAADRVADCRNRPLLAAMSRLRSYQLFLFENLSTTSVGIAGMIAGGQIVYARRSDRRFQRGSAQPHGSR